MDPSYNRSRSFPTTSSSDNLSTDERDGDTASNQPGPVAQATIVRALSETQTRFSSISDVLDSALSRLQSIHHTLHTVRSNGRNGNYYGQDDSPTSSTSNMGPRHAAIVLSANDLRDDPQFDSDALDALQRYDAPEHIRTSVRTLLTTIRQMTQLAAGLPSYNEDRTGSVSASTQTNNQVYTVPIIDQPQIVHARTIPILPSSPVVSSSASTSNTPQPPRLPAFRRRSLLENHLRRSLSLRESLHNNSNDSSTLLGRRVAARIASGTTEDNRDSTRANAHVHHNIRFLPSEIRFETNPSRVRIPIFDAETAANSTPSANDEGQENGRGDLSRDQGGSERGSVIRNIRTLLEEIGGSNLFRPLSGPDIQTISAPRIRRMRSFGDVQPPMSRDAPSRRRPQADADVQTTTQDPPDEEPFSFDFDPLLGDRSYTIRRHYTADGDEVVHNISMDSLLDGMENDLLRMDPEHRSQPVQPSGTQLDSWGINIPPSFDVHDLYWGPHAGNDHRSQNSRNTSNGPSPTVRRQRGWARLNADGDEIPIDEEEELERARTQRRIQQQANRVPLENLSAAARVRMEYLSPAARAVTSYPETEFSNWGPTRLAGSQPDGPLDFYRERGSRTTTTTEMYFGSDIPFHISPLPMPLSVMIPKTSKSDPHEEKKTKKQFPPLSEFAAR